MEFMSRIPHRKLYRLAVKLYKSYYTIIRAFTIPAATLWKKRLCVVVENIRDPAVYIDKECEKDLQAVQSLFVASFKITEEKAPIWRRRAGRLFGSVVITNYTKGNVVSFHAHQRCCYFNPWKIAQLGRQDMEDPGMRFELASFIVFVTCQALLWERHAKFMKVRDRMRLESKARARFLLRCLNIPRDGGTLAKIMVAKTKEDFANIGITPDDVRANPSIFSIIAGIKVAERHAAELHTTKK
jgi:hypothetical protein